MKRCEAEKFSSYLVFEILQFENVKKWPKMPVFECLTQNRTEKFFFEISFSLKSSPFIQVNTWIKGEYFNE